MSSYKKKPKRIHRVGEFSRTMGLYQVIGANIKAAREKRGVTQDDLADRIGIHRVSLANMEDGRVRFPLFKVERIAEALDISVWDLLRK